MLMSRKTLDVMGADGATGPSTPPPLFPELLKSVTAPYPSVPATANMARFCSTTENVGDLEGLLSLFDDDNHR